MEVFISVSRGKSVRKKSKTLAKKSTVKKKKVGTQKKGSFHKMSRRSQILYIKRHPGSKYTMKDVKPKKKGEKDPEVKETAKRKARAKKPEKEQPAEEDELDADTGGDDQEEDETSDTDTDSEIENDEEDILDGEEDEDQDEKTEGDPEEELSHTEKAETLISKIGKIKHRAKSIATAVRRKSKKKEIQDTLDDIKETREGMDVEPKKRANTLKTLGKIALIGLTVAGGVALYTQMGPVGLVIAKEFMSQMMWDSKSNESVSAARNEVEFVELTKSMLDFITNMDEKELAKLLKQAESNNKL